MKRFYKDVIVRPDGGGWQVLLDERAIKTAGGAAQVVFGRALADALAQEWAAQGTEIDPAAFIFRDLADYAIDVIAADRTAAIGKLIAYAETDTLCYRADPDQPLYKRQFDIWEPLLGALEMRHAIQLTRISGIIHRAQPAESLDKLRAVLDEFDDASLAALTTLASLAASLTIGLAAMEEGADPVSLWAAANLEEDWQAEQWGTDAEAQQLRTARLARFTAAQRFAALAREQGQT